MNLNEEALNNIEELAYRLIPPGMIAINMQLDECDFLDQIRIQGSDVRNAFFKGYVRQTIECREARIKSAQKEDENVMFYIEAICYHGNKKSIAISAGEHTNYIYIEQCGKELLNVAKSASESN